MEDKKFHLPPSLKGKVFRAGEFFKQKAKMPSSTNFLLENLSGIRRVETPEGAFLHRRITIPLDGGRLAEGYVFPGGCQLSALVPGLLSLLSGDPDCEISAPSSLLFLDLETTGLAGGTGTYPFLCGIGFFEENAFIVEQFFMEDYPYERAMLSQLAERVKAAEAFVTFNGKAFDVPLLATRFIFNRIPISLEIPHIDLLHPSRRLWRETLPDCRLESIEREFFQMTRERDVDSSLIPQIYFNFVRGRHREWILPVFDHNVQDIATLGALLVFFCRILSDPAPPELKKPFELWGLGRLFLKLGRTENALRSLEQALYLAKEPDLIETLLVHIGRLYKKLERWEESARIWEQLLECSKTHCMSAAVELAKYYEHRAREPHRAREVILRVLKGVEITSELESYVSGMESDLFPELTPEIEKRLRRLDRKIRKKAHSKVENDS